MLLLLLISYDPAVVDRVDVIELNHYCDAMGNVVLSQVIFWDWNYRDSRFEVRDWRLYKCHMRPLSSRDGCKMRWLDKDIFRRVHAKQFAETWTGYDPEVVDRRYLPCDQRRLLSCRQGTRP